VTADGESSEELHPPTALLDNSSTGSSDDDAETYGPGADMSTNGPVDPSSAGRAAEGPDGNNSKATGEEPLILGPGEAFPLPSFLDGTHLDIELVMRFCPEPGGAGLDQLLQQGLGDGGGWWSCSVAMEQPTTSPDVIFTKHILVSHLGKDLGCQI
jgi:hypothetical protein